MPGRARTEHQAPHVWFRKRKAVHSGIARIGSLVQMASQTRRCQRLGCQLGHRDATSNWRGQHMCCERTTNADRRVRTAEPELSSRCSLSRSPEHALPYPWPPASSTQSHNPARAWHARHGNKRPEVFLRCLEGKQQSQPQAARHGKKKGKVSRGLPPVFAK